MSKDKDSTQGQVTSFDPSAFGEANRVFIARSLDELEGQLEFARIHTLALIALLRDDYLNQDERKDAADAMRNVTAELFIRATENLAAVRRQRTAPRRSMLDEVNGIVLLARLGPLGGDERDAIDEDQAVMMIRDLVCEFNPAGQEGEGNE